ncbi:MAG: hypothetical protein SGPRY_015005 [Prymnesium sp.]
MRDDRTCRAEEWVRPLLGGILAVKGLARGTRLAGVQAIKEDGILAYFNRDNRAGGERLATGHYAMFRSVYATANVWMPAYTIVPIFPSSSAPSRGKAQGSAGKPESQEHSGAINP